MIFISHVYFRDLTSCYYLGLISNIIEINALTIFLCSKIIQKENNKFIYNMIMLYSLPELAINKNLNELSPNQNDNLYSRQPYQYMNSVHLNQNNAV